MQIFVCNQPVFINGINHFIIFDSRKTFLTMIREKIYENKVLAFLLQFKVLLGLVL